MKRKIRHIVIHCADTPADMDIGASDIDRWHRERGWSAIGYHYVIRRNGITETGRDLDADGDIDEEIGAHVLGHNKDSLGICLVGGKGADGLADCNFTACQWAALERIVSDLTARYPDARVVGHRDLDPGKPCPGFDVPAWWAGAAA